MNTTKNDSTAEILKEFDEAYPASHFQHNESNLEKKFSFTRRASLRDFISQALQRKDEEAKAQLTELLDAFEEIIGYEPEPLTPEDIRDIVEENEGNILELDVVNADYRLREAENRLRVDQREKLAKLREKI